MAVTKRITIRKTVKAAVDYIIDMDKTLGGAPADNEKALTYIADDVKTMHGDLVYGHLCHPDTAADDFELTRKQNLENVGKDPEENEEVLAHHFIISFRAEDPITPEGALEFAKELIKKEWEYHQAVAAVHTNTDNLHIHIVMNAHTTDPELQYGALTRMKYNSDRKSFQHLRDVVDGMCIERGLSIEKQEFQGRGTTWHENNDRKQGSTLFKNIIKDKIKEAAENSSSWEEYKKNLKDLGVEVSERGKTISYKLDHEQMNRPIRDKRLGGNYSKEAIIDYITNPPEKEKTQYYSNSKFPNYKVRSVSMTGRPRPISQLILNLAIVILTDSVEKAPEGTSQKWKLQKQLQDAIDNNRTRAHYGINTMADLKGKLTDVGTKINNYKIEIERLKEVISKRGEPTWILFQIENSEKEGLTDIDIVRLKEDFTRLTGLPYSEAGKFREEASDYSKRLLVAESEIKGVNKEYRELAKLRDGIQKAKDPKHLKPEVEIEQKAYKMHKQL